SMGTFHGLLQHLESQPDVTSCNSITTLFCFISITSRLKEDIILVQLAQASISEPPPVLSPAFNTFLATACSISPVQANDVWMLLQDVIWHGAIDKDLSSVWVTDAPRRGFGTFTHSEYLLYPPTQYCTQPDCPPMTLKKAEQQNVVLFILAHGPCAAQSVHLYCTDCQIDYRHNYTMSGGIRTYYDKQPETIQVTDHVFMEKDVVELFKMAMDVSWTSATNCAQLYNMCLSQGKCAPDGYLVKFEITGDHVWNAFVITTLLEDRKRHMCSLTVPQTGNQWDWFTQVMIDRNHRIQLYGFEDVHRHYCNRCTRMYANDQGVTTHKVSVVVVDGVTVGHPCCAVHNCHTPLSNNHHQFCPAHSSYDGTCSIIGCNLPVVPGHCTCSMPDHKNVEGTYELHGQSRFQLQERLACARVAHSNNTISQDVEISMLHLPDAEEEYELNETGTLALPVVDGGDLTPAVNIGHGQSTRTHNEQLMVAPCGMIIACRLSLGQREWRVLWYVEAIVSLGLILKIILLLPF
ncbi:uncharacterized protein F5891DRAFT_948423, partial [Suillus fuscotomentosus]